MHRPCGNPACPVCAVRVALERLNSRKAVVEMAAGARYELTPAGRAALEADPSQLELEA